MGRHSCCYKQKLRKGLWSPEEDEKLLGHITKYGHGCWSSVPKQAGLQRCGKSCRLRWINYLRPDLKRGTFSQQEENLIINLHEMLGNRWSQIAAQLPGRTDNEIKNLWNSCLKKKLRQRGIDPVTHKPLSEVENNGEDKYSPTNKTQDMELNLLEAKSPSGPNNLQEKNSSPVSAQSYQLEDKSSPNSKTINSSNTNSNLMTAISNKDFFLERFATSHNEGGGGGGSTSNCQPSDFVGHFPLHQLDYAASNSRLTTHTIPSLWFTQSSSKNFDMNSEFSSTSVPTILPPTTAASYLSTSISFKPSDDPSPLVSFQMNNSRFWEAGAASNNSNSSSGSSGNGELQSNSSFFENTIFPWGMGEKEAQNQMMGSQQEEVKWPEFIQNPLLMATATTLQNQQSLYNEIKSEAHFLTENSTGIWGHTHTHNQHQQQEPFQNSDICPKDIQRLTAAYGHI